MRFLTLLPMLFAQPALADVTVRFVEGAPTDRFVIEAEQGMCEDAVLTLDLAPSAGQLIFDVTDQGLGVDVFQPFNLVSGAEFLEQIPQIADGDRVVSLGLSAMPAGAAVAFTIDVDDTIGAREITVAGAEIAGATVSLAAGASRVSAVFGADAVARIDWPGCPG